MALNNLYTSLFGEKQRKKTADPALRQGSAFLYMQHEIVEGVLPDLPLMDQTTGPGLGSIVESLTTMDKTTNPLQKQDMVEQKKIAALEDKFNKTLSDYTQSYKSYTGALAHGTGAGTPQMEALHTKLIKLNEQLLTITNEIWKGVQSVNSRNAKLAPVAASHRNNLQARMKALEKAQNQLKQKADMSSTLSGEIDNRNLNVDATYMHYIVWFIAAVTIGAVSVQQLSK